MTTAKVAPSTVSVKVYILDKEYQIQCPPKEKHQLIQAAVDVENRMRMAKKSVGTNISAENAAVLTALNLANELQGATDNTEMLVSVSDSIIDMKARIDKALRDKPKEINSGENTPETQSIESQPTGTQSQAQLL